LFFGILVGGLLVKSFKFTLKGDQAQLSVSLGSLILPSSKARDIAPLETAILKSVGGAFSNPLTEIRCTDQSSYVIRGIISDVKPGDALKLLEWTDGYSKMEIKGDHFEIV